MVVVVVVEQEEAEESVNWGRPERDHPVPAERERLLRLALTGTRASVERAQTVGLGKGAGRFSGGDTAWGLGNGGGGGKGSRMSEHDGGNSERESSMMSETHSSSSTS